MAADESERSDALLGSTQTLASDESAGSKSRSELPAEGETIGRYVIASRLGAGGMGIVFAAHDPELDRDVAVKLLRFQSDEGSPAHERLRREAQALAQLNHPNVVTVHDVGVHQGSSFVAMELVEGQTLARWLASPRPWAEVLRIFAAAGAGLVAAHDAGIVHRDFKPENVMIGSQRVCVMDFGLARLADDEPPSSSSASTPSISHAGTLTRTGAVMGTPAYMAPEQFAHSPITTRTDQFSFCVALYEALYRERPFAGEGFAELAVSVSEGKVRPEPPDHGVPRWIRPVVLRGLAVDPNDRFASMSALLAALRAPARGRRFLAGVAVAAGIVGASVIGWQHHVRARQGEACVAAGDVIDTVWSDAEAESVERGLAAAGIAADNVAALVARLRAHADAWRVHGRVACLRSTVEPTWDAATIDKARWCLDERRVQLRTLVEVLADAGERGTGIVHTLAPRLNGAQDCTDEASLAALQTPPSAELDAELVEVRGELARAEMLVLVGKPDEALSVARAASDRAEDLPWPRTHALSLAVLAEVLIARGQSAEAVEVASSAHAVASAASSWDVAFATARMLAGLVVERGGSLPEARKWIEHGESALARLDDRTGALRADYLTDVGNFEYAMGDYRAAIATWEEALELDLRVLGPDHADVASVHNNLGNVYDDVGRYREAWAQHQRALEIRRELFDGDHPKIAGSLNNLGIVAMSMGRYAEARDLLLESAAMRERIFGPDHAYTAEPLHNLGVALERLGDHAAAKVRFDRARAIREAALGPDHPAVADSLEALTLASLREGDVDEARELGERALAIRENAFGADHVALAPSLGNLGRLHAAAGRHAQAKDAFERALVLRERANGREHAALVELLVGLAEANAALGEREAAVVGMDRAIAIASAKDSAADLLARTRFAKARLMWADTDARATAIALAEQAREGLERSSTERAEIEAWLQSHTLGQ